jgi:hypothetical protein
MGFVFFRLRDVRRRTVDDWLFRTLLTRQKPNVLYSHEREAVNRVRQLLTKAELLRQRP